MKKYFKFLTSFLLLLNVMFCKSQQIYPLNYDYNTIADYSYLKDINNELDVYSGIYKANYDNKEIILYISKETHRLIELTDKKFYRDVLFIKYIIKSSSGVVLQETQSMNFLPNQKRHVIYSMRTIPQIGVVALNYGGTNCGIGWGEIILKKLNATQFSWDYRPNSRIIDSATCPPSVDKTVYLPVTKDLIFTKQ